MRPLQQGRILKPLRSADRERGSRLRVVILTLGTLGDVQPFVALGAGLKAAGHEVTLVTGRGLKATVSDRGLRYVALDVDLLELVLSQEGRAAIRSPRGALRVERGL